MGNRQKENIQLEEIKSFAKPFYAERFFHNWDHIENGLLFIDGHYCSYQLSEEMERKYFLLRIAFIFHDIVYDIKSKTNEIESVNLMKKYFYKNEIVNENEINNIETYIMATLHHDKTGSEKDSLISLMIEADLSEVIYGGMQDLLNWESKILKEFNKFPLKIYIDERIKFLCKHESWNPRRIKDLCACVYDKSYSICYCSAKVFEFAEIKKLLSIFDKVILVNQENKFLECVEEIPTFNEIEKIYNSISYRIYFINDDTLPNMLKILEDKNDNRKFD